jgi:tetratricopeptide (TPR) repeat protein
MEARSCFELGNVRAIRGERELALETFLKATVLAQQAGDPFQEALGHNNAAYNALHIGKLTIAREHIEAGLAVAEMHQLVLPYQWLYSTRGELAMAEGNYAEAESWFRRGLVETERLGNRRQAANYQVNLGLVAWGQGDLERAALLLEEACEQIEQLSAPYLSAQTSLWLAEIYWERGEHIAALQAIARVKTKLEKSEYRHLQAWMQRLTMVRDHVKTGTFRFFP